MPFDNAPRMGRKVGVRLADAGYFGPNIRVMLAVNGKTRAWLAEQVGVTNATISRYVHGVTPPARLAEEIAAALGSTVDHMRLTKAFRPAPVVGYFAKNMRMMLSAKGLTLSWLAEQVGCSCSKMTKYASGGTAPDAKTAAAIASALGTTVEYMCQIQADDDPRPSGHFAANMRSLLSAKGKTQAWLAEQVGITSARINQHIRGNPPSLHRAEAIAAALGTTVKSMIGDEPMPVTKRKIRMGYFAANIRSMLSAKGKTQTWLAEQIGVSNTKMSHLIWERHLPKEAQAVAIATALGTTIDDMTETPPLSLVETITLRIRCEDMISATEALKEAGIAVI